MNAPDKVVEIDRRTYIGSSDAAAILGLSKWRTPLDVFRRKTGEVVENLEDDERRAKVLRRGKRLEPIVIDMLIEEYGVEVTKRSPPENPNRYEHPDHRFIKAEVDFEFRVTAALLDQLPPGFINPNLLGTIQNGEVKTVHPLAAHLWGEEFTQDVPIDYAGQSMHGLMVTGKDICLYATLVGADDLVLYKIERDDETIAGILQKEVHFWMHHVGQMIPPDPINMEDIKSLYTKVKGRPLEVPQEIAKAVSNIVALRGAQASNELAIEEEQFKIAAYVLKEWGAPPPQVNEKGKLVDDGVKENAELRVNGMVIATWNRQASRYLDQKRLAVDHPELVQAYQKPTAFRVLRSKKAA